MYAGGSFTQIFGQTRNGIAKINSNASLATWNPDANNYVNSIAIDGTGYIYIGGGFTSVGGQGRNRIAKISSDGTVDTWNPNADSDLKSICLDNNGNMYASGNFSSICGYTRPRFAKFTTATIVNIESTVNNKDNISAFPNPTTGQITLILGDKKEDVVVEILNIIGEVIQSRRIKAADDITETINISKQPAGLYFIKIQAGKEYVVRKIIKQ